RSVPSRIGGQARQVRAVAIEHVPAAQTDRSAGCSPSRGAVEPGVSARAHPAARVELRFWAGVGVLVAAVCARWTAGRALVQRGARPEEIQGGFEWIGVYDFENAQPVASASGYE